VTGVNGAAIMGGRVQIEERASETGGHENAFEEQSVRHECSSARWRSGPHRIRKREMLFL
jgi:hypothetical protein